MTRIGFDELRRLLDAYERPLALYARQWTDEAEDVVQESFVALVEQPRSPDRPAAWLFRAVRNAAISRRRSESRRRLRERAVGAARADDSAERVEDRLDAETAARALEKLPPEEREVVVARVWGGLSFAEIAELAGSSPSTAFRRYEAGLSALRTMLRAPCPPNE